MRAVRGFWPSPLCIKGDFNVTTSPNERKKGGRVNSAMRRFTEVIDDLGLRDLPLQGGPFTWSGGITSRVMSTIDRFLVSIDCESYFSKVIQCTMPRPVLNHFPILLDGGEIISRPSPFRFESMWLKSEGFKDILKGWWQSLSFKGSPSYSSAVKLKAMKGILKTWNKEVFGNVRFRKVKALRRVCDWDNLENEREFSLEEFEERVKARIDYNKWTLIKEVS